MAHAIVMETVQTIVAEVVAAVTAEVEVATVIANQKVDTVVFASRSHKTLHSPKNSLT
jgi:hypothetical protein